LLFQSSSESFKALTKEAKVIKAIQALRKFKSLCVFFFAFAKGEKEANISFSYLFDVPQER